LCEKPALSALEYFTTSGIFIVAAGGEVAVSGLGTIYGLGSAFSWGAGDFCGGLASQRSSVFVVLFVSQAVGGLLLAVMALLLGLSFPVPRVIILGAGAGLFGLFGLICLYSGLSMGRMGIVAPLAALVAVILPVTFGFITEGVPRPIQVAGFGVALLSIWLLSFSGLHIQAEQRVILLAVAAGTCFGLFFVLMGAVAQEAVLWPIIAARWAAVLVLFGFCVLRGEPLLPPRGKIPLMCLAGVLDTAGNGCFALAAQTGRLDISVVLSSLYPAVTVVLSFLLLRERLSPRQWSGVLSAMAAIALIVI
jgi:drug/metabolite transporter (DMT)-like permease